MTPRENLRGAVYGDGDVPRWFDECIAAIEREAVEAYAARLRDAVEDALRHRAVDSDDAYRHVLALIKQEKP